MILRGECHDLDIALFEEELCSVAQGLLDGNSQVRPSFWNAPACPTSPLQLQQRFGLPIFDLSSLACMVAAAVDRKID